MKIMDNQLKTATQIAAELGCSPQAVYTKIKILSDELKPFRVKQGNCTLYTIEGQQLIISSFQIHRQNNIKTDFKAVDNELERLSNELESLREKNNKLQLENAELKGKNETLKQLIENFKVSQLEVESLLNTIDKLTTALQAAQALHGIEKKQQIIKADMDLEQSNAEHQKGIFKKLKAIFKK